MAIEVERAGHGLRVTRVGVAGVYARIRADGTVLCGIVQPTGHYTCGGRFGDARADGTVLLGARWRRDAEGAYWIHPAQRRRAAIEPPVRRTVIAAFPARARCPVCGRVNIIQGPGAGAHEGEERR